MEVVPSSGQDVVLAIFGQDGILAIFGTTRSYMDTLWTRWEFGPSLGQYRFLAIRLGDGVSLFC